MTSTTVIGLGPMGQAMTRTLLAAGHSVTVWNRTPSRADDVVAAGAVLAATPTDALEASELILLSLTDYQAMWDILGASTGSLAGRTVVNLSSDTPDQTTKAADWAASYGARFLTGGLMVPAVMIGTDHAYAYYSGDPEAFETYRTTLAQLGDPRFLGADPQRAQLMYQANLDVFLATMTGLAHATALVGAAGIPAQDFLAEVTQLLTGFPAMIAADGVGARIDAGDHRDDGANILMLKATADHIRGASEALGVDAALPQVVQSYFRQAIDAGHGADSWTRIVELFRRP
ncbi:NAD(P)-dependent oxidoreductase [Kribbella sandramycini]|uniref:3-hydroxyisobutyrate dehydrogenase-like beta-hydroxyacid dehydrogenase n=1 Tax=Kribbella sandramycini TaxID=60450 RepID=A0A7Y4NZ28_9ACTN|nr:NAD(P)-binding domain-containing protein [Kribbella sandramycini]MBB6569775.1 3-hydroxyisobutyrate dehydrogenase-like beta-hydroxyacid dehydrogenase [Kribbella sandramycini]NOL40398.1 NAD(P)-dependent oxidoreductase [Kribbella sandramycini]